MEGTFGPKSKSSVTITEVAISIVGNSAFVALAVADDDAGAFAVAAPADCFPRANRMPSATVMATTKKKKKNTNNLARSPDRRSCSLLLDGLLRRGLESVMNVSERYAAQYCPYRGSGRR